LACISHLDSGEPSSPGEAKMSSRKEKVLFNLLLGTGIYLLDSMRNRMAGTVDDLRSRAHDTYDTASDRVSRATDVIRGTDHPMIGTAAAALLGLGIGVGIGLLLAPASGEETRSNIASKARDIRDRVSSRESATGTYGG
jgi:ElaB/YqjD/DUF883 family membrane-anchored ribosome-binding protein